MVANIGHDDDAPNAVTFYTDSLAWPLITSHIVAAILPFSREIRISSLSFDFLCLASFLLPMLRLRLR